jgi:hypothetical protein
MGELCSSRTGFGTKTGAVGSTEKEFYETLGMQQRYQNGRPMVTVHLYREIFWRYITRGWDPFAESCQFIVLRGRPPNLR